MDTNMETVWGFLVVVLLSTGDIMPGTYGPFKDLGECNMVNEQVTRDGRSALPDQPKFKRAVVLQVNPCFSIPKKV